MNVGNSPHTLISDHNVSFHRVRYQQVQSISLQFSDGNVRFHPSRMPHQ